MLKYLDFIKNFVEINPQFITTNSLDFYMLINKTNNLSIKVYL